MNWDSIKNTLSKGAELVKQKSLDTVEYLKSEEFKESVSEKYQKTKEGVGNLVGKVKESEAAQKISQGTKSVFEDIKKSNVVQKIGAKGKELKDSVVGKEESKEEGNKKVFTFEETEENKEEISKGENASFKF